jgi:hypothetical protein
MSGWGHEILCNEDELNGTPSALVPIIRALAPPEMFVRDATPNEGNS